jgi:hypothetical protein
MRNVTEPDDRVPIRGPAMVGKLLFRKGASQTVGVPFQLSRAGLRSVN